MIEVKLIYPSASEPRETPVGVQQRAIHSPLLELLVTGVEDVVFAGLALHHEVDEGHHLHELPTQLHHLAVARLVVLAVLLEGETRRPSESGISRFVITIAFQLFASSLRVGSLKGTAE